MHLRRTRLAVLAIAAITLGAIVMPAAAVADSNQPAVEKKVTLQVTGMPVVDAIDMLFRDTGYKYTIRPGVSGRLTLNIVDMPFEQALKKTTDLAHLEYRVVAGRYIISPNPKEEVEAAVPPGRTTEEPQTEQQAGPGYPPATGWRQGAGPIFYGRGYYWHRQPVFPLSRGYMSGSSVVILPDGTALVNGWPYGYGPPPPPPGVFSPSTERFLAQIAALDPYLHPSIRSYLPYPFYPWGGY